jgi:hypothetical protein
MKVLDSLNFTESQCESEGRHVTVTVKSPEFKSRLGL